MIGCSSFASPRLPRRSFSRRRSRSPRPQIGQGKTTIGVSLAQDDNPFYIAMLRGIRARAQELGWDVATVSANEDKLKQINGVQDLIARGVKGILISPIDAVGVNAAYDAAAAAKVPIVSVARGSTSKNQTIHVAMDEKQIGRDIAEWTAKRLNGKGKVALLLGPSGAPTFRNLGDGYAELMAKYPGIQIVAKHDGPLTRERGLKQAEDALVAHPDLAAIYAANDDVALGAMQAVNAANRKDKTIVTGMNGVPPALRAVKDKNLAMTVELNPVLWGRLGVDVLASFLKGDKVEPRVFIKHVIIDPSNVDSQAAEDLIMTLTGLLWLATACYAIHMLEEYQLDWRDWARDALGLPVEWSDFYVTNAIVVVLGIVAANLTAWPVIALGFAALMLINATFFHVLPMIVMRGRYSPGVFTAVVLFYPVGIACYRQAAAEGTLSTGAIAGSFLIGAALMASPIVLLRIKHKPYFRQTR